MKVRASTGDACITYRFEGGESAWKIDKSVGQGGWNVKADVLKIQRLLNMIALQDGGPMPPLAEDGLVGPKTIGAIRRFQEFHRVAHDGRVDPDGPTLKAMNAVPKRALGVRNAGRLARAAQVMPDLIAMADKARRAAEAAMDSLSHASAGFSKRPFEIAELYFAFGKQPQSATVSELAFVRTTFVRVKSVLVSRVSPITGGTPFGVSIFTIDPLGKDWMAYSPMQLGDDNREIPEVHSGHVYLCSGLDSSQNDLFAHILMHELVHFVDDESQAHQIVDYGYREKAMKLPHNLRMRNSDNYALFASHLHIGRGRLIASQPSLQPHIPAHL